MKQSIFFLLFICYTSLLFSQSSIQLDQKYGFKHFKFNTSASNYSEEIMKVKSWDPHPKVQKYKYIGNDIEYVVGVKRHELTLTFYDDKLMSIMITFGNMETDFTKEEFDLVQYSLEELYGKPYDLEWSNPDLIKYGGVTWTGEKVSLELLRLYYKPTKKIGGYISIVEKSIQKKRISNDF